MDRNSRDHDLLGRHEARGALIAIFIEHALADTSVRETIADEIAIVRDTADFGPEGVLRHRKALESFIGELNETLAAVEGDA